MATYSSNVTIQWVAFLSNLTSGGTIVVPANHFLKGQIFAEGTLNGAGSSDLLVRLRLNNTSGAIVFSKSPSPSTNNQMATYSVSANFDSSTVTWVARGKSWKAASTVASIVSVSSRRVDSGASAL